MGTAIQQWVTTNQGLIRHWATQITYDKGQVQDVVSKINLWLLTQDPLSHWDESRAPLRPFLKTCIVNYVRSTYKPHTLDTTHLLDTDSTSLPTYEYVPSDFLKFCVWYRDRGHRIAHATKIAGILNLVTLRMLLKGLTRKEMAKKLQVCDVRVSQRVRDIRQVWHRWSKGFYLLR